MILAKFTELKDFLARDRVILYYQGAISHDLVVEIAEIVKRHMIIDDVGSSTIMKVFAAVIEQLQNILYYSAEIISPAVDAGGAKEMRGGVIMVGQEQDHYYVIGGNLIEQGQVGPLRDRLHGLQGLSKEELKQYCKEQRRQEPGKGSRGAGLGIIEIARKASCPIDFDFVPAEEGTVYFYLKAII